MNPIIVALMQTKWFDEYIQFTGILVKYRIYQSIPLLHEVADCISGGKTIRYLASSVSLDIDVAHFFPSVDSLNFCTLLFAITGISKFFH